MPGNPFSRLDAARRRLSEGQPGIALSNIKGLFPRHLEGEARFLRAEALRAQGFFDRAIAEYRHALGALDRTENDLAIEAWLGLTRCHRSLGNVAQAMHALARARKCDGADDPDIKETISLEHALVLRASGQYGRALRQLKTLLRISRRRQDWSGVGFILWAIGGAQRFSGNLRQSHQDFRNSLSSFERAADREGQIYALFGLGGIARIRGRFSEARLAYAEAGRLLGTGPDLFGRAYAHCGLANVLRQLGRWNEADRHYRDSYALYAKLDDRVDLAYVDWGIGQIHLKRGELKRAKRRFNAARKAFAQHREARGEALSLQALAHVEHALGRTASAEALFDAAVTRSRKAGLHAHLEVFT